MSRPNTPHVIEDDDEFDWDAAVREIDVACEKGLISESSTTTTSFPTFSRNQDNVFRPNSRKPSVARQSTLDKFIQSHQSINPRNVSDFREEGIRNVGGGGGGGGGGGEDYDNGNSNGSDDLWKCYCKIDPEAAKTWIYPVNIPLRDYQLSITRTALFQNTLVALPTGLGKTFIAAVVMYNYFRWFPEGKIVFAAPSRPLVLQQIEACHNIVGIHQEWTIDLTGQTSPSKRACLWKNKRVFFVTPQVLEKDIQSGICLTKYIVCLVIDEAHRASGNYSYCVAFREMMALKLRFRLLALTATPGSKQQTIQNVIDNLQISKLEYRSEGDVDVRPYVHERKQEVIRVAMGNDADDINRMLLDVISPLVLKLSSRGVYLKGGSQSLSPVELIDIKRNFRNAPRQDLCQMQRDELDLWLGVLITLISIRKLLSSHGIQPAWESLQEKMKKKYFANFTNKNELMWKIKLKMKRSLANGAPSPKLLKMIDILTDHFKTNDPKKSRVIIFSNYRSSVRDIMNSLSSIGDRIKATEFIGQSSGKTLKGQTQKVQQAVLQKFRDGEYNIIVATSIGEEGLDIMEVDLIISFDANISPLRMIQRMGRTGRKNDGRVVILACEGPEYKGYLRKQASSKAVKKFLQNGGNNYFKFPLSSRMVPHIFNPEVKFVEFLIEKFVPRGKKVRENPLSDRTFQDNLSDAEAELIAKYFKSSRKHTWRPSLIAFPHFQAFPSRVHNVMHSLRTSMLIGTMQHLQAPSISLDSRALPDEVQDKTSSFQCFGAESVPQDDNYERDYLDTQSVSKTSRSEASRAVIFSCTEKLYVSAPPSQNPPIHCFLFEATYISVNPSGTVSITSVPSLPFVKSVPTYKTTEENTTDLPDIVKPNLTNPAETNGIHNCDMSTSRMCSSSDNEEVVVQEVENVFSTPTSKRSHVDSEVIVHETPILLDEKDTEMSPRLSNMIDQGIVPESPLAEIGNPSLSPVPPLKSLSSERIETVKECKNAFASEYILDSPESLDPPRDSPVIVNEKTRTPLVNLTNSCSNDWRLSSGEACCSIQQPRKLKRLRKYGEVTKKISSSTTKDNLSTPTLNRKRSCTRRNPQKHIEGKRKMVTEARAFIEEEAEVSCDAEVSSDDEEDDNENLSSDSFIDDRINPTMDTQAEAIKNDMMAFYRRSLLSQSPMPYITETTEETETGSCSSEKPSNHSLQTPQIDSSSAEISRVKNVPTETSAIDESKIQCRKRKLSFHPETIQPQRLFEPEVTTQQCQPDNNVDAFSDDQFYEGLDLDALEAQATNLLKCRSQLPAVEKSYTLSDSPSFDLGI